jgi:hypothetical protein
VSSRLDRRVQRTKPRREDRKLPAFAVGRADRICVAVRSVSRVPRGALVPGAIVWTWVPFEEDNRNGKFRPAVIISPARDGTMSVVPCATRRDGGRLVPIEHWETAGLTRPGGFQPRIAETEVRDCTEVVGHLAAEDHERLEHLVARLDPQRDSTVLASVSRTIT